MPLLHRPLHSIAYPKLDGPMFLALIGDLCQLFVIDKVRSVLEQFKRGLSTLNILSFITAHPRELETAFCYNPKTLTAMEVDTLFIPCFEEEGTHLRDKQEIMMMNWKDYLQDCEGLYR